MARRGGEIVGVLPPPHVQGRIFGNSLISSGFGVYGCPVAATPQALVALDAAAVALARYLRVDRIEYRLREALNPAWPCNRETYVPFRNEIAREVEQGSEEQTSELQSLMPTPYPVF